MYGGKEEETFEAYYNKLHLTALKSSLTTAASCAFLTTWTCKHTVYTYISLMLKSHLECVYSSFSSPRLPLTSSSTPLLPLSPSSLLWSSPLSAPYSSTLCSLYSLLPFPLLLSPLCSLPFPQRKHSQYNYVYKSSVSSPSCQTGPRIQAVLSSSLSEVDTK